MAQQIQDNQRFTGIRLPKNIKPIHYDLTLIPNLENFTFSGKVKINYVIVDDSPTQSIILHANELKINDGYIQSESNPINTLTSVTYSDTSETATLDFQKQITPVGLISLSFEGSLNDKLMGFYRTTFKVNNESFYAATTHFEPTGARKCFPCWDEPAIRATFSVCLIFSRWTVSNDQARYERVALSNMPEVSRNQVGDEVEVKFEKTPFMSTYLLAFIVGPFEMIEKREERRIVRVYTTLGKKDQGRFALDVACKSLTYYENYFKINYPLPKMDLIAIPDFPIGAMENWGLVTYRETRLLVDPKETSKIGKQNVALVVAHELAHQWFGNLVTIEWWTHLWLKEGFATFMEYLCVDNLLPDYDVWTQFVTDAHGCALELDSLNNSHPIEVPIGHASEIAEIFDAISYQKGASVIRMLYNYIGDNDFRKGMNDYLTKFSYKSAITEDLWNSLESASNKPIGRLMSCWTLQKGFPWLSVDEHKSDGTIVKLTISQAKFNASGLLLDDESAVKWIIPLNAITGKSSKCVKEICLIENKTTEITIEDVGDSWFKLNPSSIGLYRTAYPQNLTGPLWNAIADKTMPPVDRLNLQSDLFALCQAGKTGSVEMLKFLQNFKGETVYTVWNSIDHALGKFNILLANIDYQARFHSYGRELYSDIFKLLTWSSASKPNVQEAHTDALTRVLIIDRLVSFGDETIILEAKRRFKAHLSGAETIPADLRGACYKAVSMFGAEDDFHNLLDIYRTTELQEEKDRIARAVGYTKDEARLEQVMKFIFSDAIRNQDKVFAFHPICVTNAQIAWKLFEDNKDFLCKTYVGTTNMSRIIKYATENLACEKMAEEVAKFFSENKFPGSDRTVQQSLEKIRLNANWLKRDSEALKTFLINFS